MALRPIVADVVIAIGLLALYWLVGRASPGFQLAINAVSLTVLGVQATMDPVSRTPFLAALIGVVVLHTALVLEAFVLARSAPGGQADGRDRDSRQ